MTATMDPFWRQLTARADLAMACDLSLEEVERRMAETDHEPLPAELIELIVAEATVERLPERAPVSISRWRRIVHSRRAAAVATATGLLLAAFFAGTLLWPSGKYPGQRLDYQKAMAVALDPRRAVDNRKSAIGVASVKLTDALTILRTAKNDPALQPFVDDGLAAINAALFRPGMPELPKASFELAPPLAVVQDTGRSPVERAAAVHATCDQIVTGVRVLKWLYAVGEPPELREGAGQGLAWVRTTLAGVRGY